MTEILDTYNGIRYIRLIRVWMAGGAVAPGQAGPQESPDDSVVQEPADGGCVQR
jgi:hypothetical protein